MINGATVLSWSRTQAAVALSSCESELYALGSACAEALWPGGLLREQGLCKTPPTIWSDSSSALALATRAGHGRLKHVESR